MTSSNLDIVAIGDAIVDVIATCDDAFLDEHRLPKGSMRLLTPDRGGRALCGDGSGARNQRWFCGEQHGGRCRARTSNAAFVGQVADDQLGAIFAHDMRSLGVRFETPPLWLAAADRTLPDPRHAGRSADDEHLPRREPRAHDRSARCGD